MTPASPRGRTLRTVAVGLAVLGLTWTGLLTGPTGTAEAASGSTTSGLADPDTLYSDSGATKGHYITYGTATGASSACSTPARKVPYFVHGSGETSGMAACSTGDAMPGGPGSWAQGAIWAPGVTKFNGKYYMYYTASRAGSGQKCIGRAVASTASGPFTNGGEWACPPAGRWAIDANPFVSGGRMYVAYRDDAVASGAETGLSVVRVDANGWAEWSSRRTLLVSTDLTWDTRGISGGTHVIENPSMFRSGGRWWVAFSGNNWNSDRYATGIADCGTSPLASGRCQLVGGGASRPYFGYTGSTGLSPYRGLPSNHRGPGGMDVFTTPGGNLKAAWHWWDGSGRRSMVGNLTQDANGFRMS